MITQKTAQAIWTAYREIAASEKLLADMAEVRERERRMYEKDPNAPTLQDAFGNRQHLQLGIPNGENSHQLFRVSPVLAESVIKAHIANKQAELAEANECARAELSAG